MSSGEDFLPPQDISLGGVSSDASTFDSFGKKTDTPATQSRHSMLSSNTQTALFQTPELNKRWLHDYFYPENRNANDSAELPTHFLDLLKRNAGIHPDSIALSENGVDIHYADFYYCVRLLSGWLIHEAGIRPGDRLGLLGPSSIAYVIWTFAAWAAEMAIVNLSQRSVDDQVLDQLQSTGAKILITTARELERIEKLLLNTMVRHVVMASTEDFTSIHKRFSRWWTAAFWMEKSWRIMGVVPTVSTGRILADRYLDHPESELKPDALAVIQFTSGTVGNPKGVMLSHRNLLTNTFQQIAHFDGKLGLGIQALSPISLHHSMAFSFVMTVLAVGGRVYFCRIKELLEQPQLFRKYPIVMMMGTPALYEKILSSRFQFDQSRLTLPLSGSSHASDSLRQRWRQITHTDLIGGYGQAETTTAMALGQYHSDGVPSREIALAPPKSSHEPPALNPLAGIEMRVVHPHTGVELGFDQIGELWVRGPQVMQGYWRLPGANYEVLQSDHWLKTGDLVKITEQGCLIAYDRCQDAFWVREQWVFPDQIEGVAQEDPSVLDSVAVGLTENGEPKIKLLVTVNSDFQLEYLQKRLLQKLPEVAQPNEIIITKEGHRNFLGRLKRRIFRESFQQNTLSAHQKELNS